MKFLKIILGVVLVSVAFSLPVDRRTRSWLDVARVTVKLVSPGGTGGSGFPVGYIYARDGVPTVLILTAAHVVRGEDLAEWSAIIADERWLGTPELVQMHRSLDAALVRVRITRGDRIPIVPLRATPAEVGEQIWVIGYPECGRRNITTGYVGELNAAAVNVFHGNSGGPAVDADGRALGIVVGAGGHPTVRGSVLIQHDMVFLPTTDLLEWVDRWLNL